MRRRSSLSTCFYAEDRSCTDGHVSSLDQALLCTLLRNEHRHQKTSHLTGKTQSPMKPYFHPECKPSISNYTHPIVLPTTLTSSKLPSEWSKHGTRPTQLTKSCQTKSRTGSRPVTCSLRINISMNKSSGKYQPSNLGTTMMPTCAYNSTSTSSTESLTPKTLPRWLDNNHPPKKMSNTWEEVCF